LIFVFCRGGKFIEFHGRQLHLAAYDEEFAIGIVESDIRQIDAASGLLFAGIDANIERKIFHRKAGGD
jgi:hypothetical protein